MSYINNNKFSKSVRYIYENIDKPINLEEIASHVGLSLSSLKRLFNEAVNQTPGVFIRKLRMEMAFRSIKKRDESILEIALSYGFEDQSAFTRRFKQIFGYSPTKAREKFNIVSELECIVLEEPDIIEINNLNIQAITETGLYFESAPRAWEKLKKILSNHDVNDDFSGIFIGIGHDNPHEGTIKEDQVRYTAGIIFLDKDLSLSKINVPDGSYARFRYKGKPTNFGMAYHYIYGKWQENSNIKINKNIPAFVTFDNFPEGFRECNALIHVPLITHMGN
jgi:AraC family transcriptional regulator